MEMIAVENLKKNFGKLEVLKGVNFSMNPGEIVSIIGPSGSGKSTLLRCLHQLEQIDGGKITVNGQSLTTPEAKRSAVLKMGMVFQNFNLFPHKTVMENIMEAPRAVLKQDKAEATARAEELLGQVGLLDKKDAYPTTLSGGQKQRIAIARALAMDPEILLFDEPTSSLDPELVGEVLKVIKELAQEKRTMIIVTHEMAFARDISHRIVFMDQGKIIEEGTPDALFQNPENERVKTFLSRMIG